MSTARVLAYAAGAAFVLASAAINVLHVVSKDGNHLTLTAWAAVAVASSIGLGVLPSAVVKSLASRRYGLAAVALVGIVLLGAFSVGNAIGSAAHTRLSQSAAAGDLQDSRTRVQAELARIDDKLAGLPSARPEGELSAKIGALLASRRDLKDCVGWLPDVKARSICIEVGELRAEAANAQERRRLEADRRDLSAKLDRMGRRGALGNADAVALAGWLQALGIVATPEAIDRVLILVAVATVEFGGGILIAVAGAFAPRVRPVLHGHDAPVDTASGHPAKVSNPTPAERGALPAPVDTGVDTCPAVSNAPPAEGAETPANTGDPEVSTGVQPLVVPADPGGRLIGLVSSRGGEVLGSHASFGVALGISRSHVANVIAELEAAGRITTEASKRGTRVRLA